MNRKNSLTTIGQPVPELPVADVEQAQEYYRDVLGFEIGWLYPGKEIGSVSRGNVAIFFRRRQKPFEPAVHWIFAKRYRRHVRGVPIVTFEDRRATGEKALGPETVHH